MVEKDDWRLTTGPVIGIEEELKNIPLYYIPFQPLSAQWDHEHCAFYWDKFYLKETCLQETTAPTHRIPEAPTGSVLRAMRILKRCLAGRLCKLNYGKLTGVDFVRPVYSY